VKVDLDLGYASGSGIIEPNKGPAISYYTFSATQPILPATSSKATVTILDESKTTGIPSIEALKTQSQYRAKVLEYYQVQYLSPLSDSRVELKVKWQLFCIVLKVSF